VLIVDEFTAAHMPAAGGPRVCISREANEGVRVKGETQTMATITIQNYFRMYDKLAGMPGTAERKRRNSSRSIHRGRGHPDKNSARWFRATRLISS